MPERVQLETFLVVPVFGHRKPLVESCVQLWEGHSNLEWSNAILTKHPIFVGSSCADAEDSDDGQDQGHAQNHRFVLKEPQRLSRLLVSYNGASEVAPFRVR